MNEDDSQDYFYAFKGRKIIAGPFLKRSDAQGFKKVGYSCRCCGSYSGGNTICYYCFFKILENQSHAEEKKGSK